METIYIIIFPGGIYHDKFFEDLKAARNYIKFNNSNRKFKENKPNEFTCPRYGTTFKILPLINSIFNPLTPQK